MGCYRGWVTNAETMGGLHEYTEGMGGMAVLPLKIAQDNKRPTGELQNAYNAFTTWYLFYVNGETPRNVAWRIHPMTSLVYIEGFDPQTKEKARGRTRVLLMDGWAMAPIFRSSFLIMHKRITSTPLYIHGCSLLLR
jgi:hypothetical protein